MAINKIVFLFVLLGYSSSAYNQSLKKYAVSKSGCSVYNYCDMKFELAKSQDSSQVYTGECVNEGVTYGIICVKLLNPVANLAMAEDLLISYADYLKDGFEITKTTGYGRGHFLNNNENTRGIIDYWEDAKKQSWKIKAWTDGKFIGFLYAFSKKQLPEGKINVFLDSFRVPGL